MRLAPSPKQSREIRRKGMKPCLSYAGGKQRMAGKIIPLLPRHTVYVEPFVGGGAILFGKPWPDVSNTHYYREVINDLDKRLVAFHRILADKKLGPELVNRLQLTPYSRDCYDLARAILHDTNASPLDTAWAYFVFGQQNFGNAIHPNGSWGTGLFGRNHGATWINRLARLPQYLERMSGVHIECKDALDVIRRWDSPQTLFYCDPPYPGTYVSYQGKYTKDHLRALFEVACESKGSFLISGYPVDYASDCFERFDFSAYSSSARGEGGEGTRGKKTEVVWRIDRSHTVRPEIQRLFDSGKFDCFGKTPVAKVPPTNGGQDEIEDKQNRP